MKILFYTVLFFSIWFIENINASEKEHDKHHDHKSIVNLTNNTNVFNTVNKSIRMIPDIQYQFNPNSNKYQMSLGMATSGFKGDNSMGVALGKSLCQNDCNNSFIHGSIKTNGKNIGGNIGLTFSLN